MRARKTILIHIGITLLFFGTLLMILDFNRLLSTTMIVLSIFLILKSLKEEEPEDERFRRLRDRALANSWILSASFISIILILSEVLNWKIETPILVSLLLLMLSTAAIFRSYYERKGDVEP